MSNRRQHQKGHLKRLPNGKTGPYVRSANGKYYMTLEDLLTYPELVHRRIIPEFGKIHVTHWEQVVLVVSMPAAADQTTEEH